MKKGKIIVLVLSLIFLSLIFYFFIENVSAVITDYTLSFVSPTPGNGAITNKIEINASITNASDLSMINYDWNGTNYTAYNNSLILMMNFENISALGENSTNVVDLSNRWNNATCTGTTCPIWNSSGRYGGAFTYNGIDQRFLINTTNNPLQNFTEFTIGTWVYINDFGSNNNTLIISNWNNFVVKKGFLLRIIRDDPLNNYWSLNLNNGTDSFNIGTTPKLNDSDFSSRYKQKWLYVVATYKSGQFGEIYINGVLLINRTGTAVPNIFVPDPNLTYLGWSGVNAGYFNGSIDSVKIWNRSLSTAEIQQEYITNLNKYASSNWSLYVNQSSNNPQKIADGNYTYYASVKDSVGSELLSGTRSVDFISVVSYSNFINNLSFQGQGARAGDTVLFNATLSAVGGLVGYITSCNFTGNDSYVPISGISYNLNFVKIANLSEGSVGCCSVWFNDTLGNSNQTSNSCFSMKSRTQINIDYTSLDHPINNMIFGQGIYGNTFMMQRIFTPTGYNSTYLPTTQSMGITNIRFNTGGGDYDWSLYANNATSESNYRRWRNYSIFLTGQEPTFVLSIQDPYNLSNLVAWVNDSVQQKFNITNWEIGNELYLSALCNGSQNVTCFALRIKEVCAAIKQVKPDVKCGLTLSPLSNSFAYGYTGINDWNTNLLSIAGNYTDFVSLHYYSPNFYFDMKSWFSSNPSTYSFNVNGNTNYSASVNVKSQTCCEASDCFPDIQIKVDGNQVLLANVTTNTTFGIYNTPYNLSLSAGTHNITVDEQDSYQNQTSNCKKAIFVANLSVTNTTEMVPVSLWDVRNWTYSMFATTDTIIKTNLANIKYNITNLVNHSMDIKLTEYNFQYCGASACFSSPVFTQYDWRGNLLTAMELNTWLQGNISQADLWTDATQFANGGEYFRYVSGDGTVKYPQYYLLNLYSSKTGNYYANYTTTNLDLYNTSTIVDPTFSPNATNEPFLSIAPSKDTIKHEYDLAIVNRNQDDDELVQINLNNDTPLDSTTYVTVLTANNLSSHPYLDGINIAPYYNSISSATSFNYTIPKYSVVFFETGYKAIPASVLPVYYQSFTLNQTQLESGQNYDILLLKNGIAQFSFEGVNHTIKLDDIINKTAILTVSSLPTTFNLTVNETKKINLNGDNYYDLQVLLNDINDYTAVLTLNFIKEAIPPGESGSASPNQVQIAGLKIDKSVLYYVGAGILIICLVLLYFILKKGKKKKGKK